ncbi:GpE family phage tail protein [Qipengyuania flava]|nr:GpE family phage tail protein [Qipengyuania flava]
MADIAAIFHWPLSDLQALTLDELAGWHRRAVERLKLMKGVD